MKRKNIYIINIKIVCAGYHIGALPAKVLPQSKGQMASQNPSQRGQIAKAAMGHTQGYASPKARLAGLMFRQDNLMLR